MIIILAISAVIAAYLLGSINFAVLFTRAYKNIDIREQGSGNAGTTNVMRVGGVVPGLLTFFGDALKGFAACMLGKIAFDYVFQTYDYTVFNPLAGAYICGTVCMFGHICPIFFGFKGGKGVATAVGIFAVCCPIAAVAGLVAFAAVTLISRYVSLGSLTATIVVIVLATVFPREDTPTVFQVVCCIVMAFMIYFKHRGNIKRLISGTERKV
ncbi:MAG: glycerol-3-phosphate 1-O-acyltransferase PlsY [Clostridia bacterium]|nr:glycerol-3-phosphate 1-O-acyltransferase PlsY [Clostridia bacterium]